MEDRTMRYDSDFDAWSRIPIFVIFFVILVVPGAVLRISFISGASLWESLLYMTFICVAIAFLDYTLYLLLLDFIEWFVLFIISVPLFTELHYSVLINFLWWHVGIQDFYLFIGLTIFNFLIFIVGIDGTIKGSIEGNIGYGNFESNRAEGEIRNIRDEQSFQWVDYDRSEIKFGPYRKGGEFDPAVMEERNRIEKAQEEERFRREQ